MKIKHLLLASLLGSFAATAGAQTVIYISGAPAARQPVSTAINRLLTSSTTGGLVTVAYSGTNTTTLTTANALTWYGGNIGGVPVTVKISYVGSSAGIQDVASQSVAKFLPNTATAAGSPYAEPNSGSNPNDPEVPNFTASDEFQASTPWKGTNSLTGSSKTYQNLTADISGVLPYRFVTNVDAPASITNITPNQAKGLWLSGYIPLSQLTGSNSDEGTAVYAVGRDIGSGLRTVLLSETGIGVQTGIQQYTPIVTSTTGSYTSGVFTTGSGAVVSGSYTYIAAGALVAPSTVNGVSLPQGDGGYSSFSGLQAVLAAYSNTNHGDLTGFDPVDASGYFVTALADSDAQTALKAGSHEVAWNGNTLGTLGTYGTGSGHTGTSSQALSEGVYTFWSYIQLQYLPSQLSSTVNATAFNFEQALRTDLRTTDSTVLLRDLNVSRTQDGGNISLGNQYHGTGF